MVKNIVFDMGNVLIRFDPERFMERYAISEEEKALLRKEVFRSIEWVMLDRGILDESAAEKTILPRLPEHLHSIAHDLIEKWDDPLLPVDGMLELVQTLKKHQYNLYLLSNAASRQHEYWKRAEVSKWMDGTLISADVKLLKPDPQIYDLFLEKFGLKPEECVFIDDTPMNVEGAIYRKMAGVVFHLDAEELKQKLCSLGVVI